MYFPGLGVFVEVVGGGGDDGEAGGGVAGDAVVSLDLAHATDSGGGGLGGGDGDCV